MNPRIGYIYLLAGHATGVERKILDQARALEQLGRDDVRIEVLNAWREGTAGKLRFVRMPASTLSARYACAFRRFDLIERSIDCAQYEKLLVRYPLADPDATGFAERHSVISEHHSKEIEERTSFLHYRLSVPQRLFKMQSLRREKRWGAAYLARCLGIVGVTDEITRYEVGRAGAVARASRTVPNGIAVDRVKYTRSRPFDGRRLDMAFVGGRDTPWHGTERLVRSVGAYRGGLELVVHLIGGRLLTVKPSLPANVRVISHGTLTDDDLDELMSSMNVAIGTMALHAKGLTEAATLKVREYMARGIPFVLGHEDPDLPDTVETAGFALRIPNDDSLLPIERLVSFAEESTRAGGELSERMRAYARRRMDWTKKMKDLFCFVGGL